ncbi:MAG TPA: hypothetical protein VGN82_14405 [Bosea sp. (in: a-proteobacteria)]|jgi:hypothetical protein|uniref:hypothetical protein n=1 Tax=Bosea sp. (in: a-proteobacteria) TaxID=1871050 RepID=UPI002E0EC3C3|nr:hypothetical protein [Bosea sp. (in: a-proteobacteria)]
MAIPIGGLLMEINIEMNTIYVNMDYVNIRQSRAGSLPMACGSGLDSSLDLSRK